MRMIWQGISRSSMPYWSFLQPYGAYFSPFMTALIIIFNGKNKLLRI